ncbi:MAG: hypothetical protein ACE5JR_12060 [Gemmatimonadota bacterium]
MKNRIASASAGPFRAGLLGPVAAGLAAIAGSVSPVTAQEDFRSADLDRPIQVEDAYPVKFREWEVELGIRGALREGGDGVSGIGELKTGLFLNGQVGLEIKAGGEDAEGSTAGGIESAGAHLLYNFNRETWSWPAFAARLDVESPGAGRLGRENWAISGKGLATRSFGRLRIHLNGGYAAASAADGGDFWLGGMAFDYPIGLFSRAIMGDIYAEVPNGSGRSRVWLELGSRWQLTNLSVLDFGLATRLDEWERGRGNVELIVGFSRVFGIPGLVTVPSYPNPRIN